jgi:hypothetical protein
MICRRLHLWISREPNEEEAKKDLGVQVCSRCGTKQLLNSDGEVVKTIRDAVPVKEIKRVGVPSLMSREPKVYDPDEKGISRQVRWQRKKRQQGCCAMCGKPAGGHAYCEKHRK